MHANATNNFTVQWLASKSDTHVESRFQCFFRLNGQKYDSIIKLSAELFTSKGRDFDTTIKLKAPMVEEYLDLHVVLKSLRCKAGLLRTFPSFLPRPVGWSRQLTPNRSIFAIHYCYMKLQQLCRRFLAYPL